MYNLRWTKAPSIKVLNYICLWATQGLHKNVQTSYKFYKTLMLLERTSENIDFLGKSKYEKLYEINDTASYFSSG